MIIPIATLTSADTHPAKMHTAGTASTAANILAKRMVVMRRRPGRMSIAATIFPNSRRNYAMYMDANESPFLGASIAVPTSAV